MSNHQYVIVNGALASANEKIFPVSSRGVAYGDGCFTTLRSYSGNFLFFDKHISRLQEGAQYLGINFDLKVEEIHSQVDTLLSKNNLYGSDCIIKILLLRQGERGFSAVSNECSYFITTVNLSGNKRPVILRSVETRAIPAISLSRKFKLTNSINYIKAVQEAERKGGNDALMLTVDGNISETTIANIFWIKGNRVFTPSASCDILPGITRSLVIGLCNNNLNVEVIEGEFKLDEALDAEVVFVSNSVREITAVSEIDEYHFDVRNPILKKIKEHFEIYKLANLK